MPYRNYYYPQYMYKRAAQPPMVDPSMMGGAPPMGDPSMMGGMPMGDPSMMGGAPPMGDPSMMAPPPPDPSMMGAPPIDPAAAGLPPAAPDPATAGDPAADPGAKKNKKQQLEDDIAEIKNAVYNQQVMTALIIKALKVPIPAEALIMPTASNMDIGNPMPDIKDFGSAPEGEDVAPPTGGDMPKQGSVASLLMRDTTKLASLILPPKSLAKEFGL